MRKVAVIADVHGNAPALAAVLAEIERERPDLIVSCGDLTWGPLPEETYELARSLNARFVRGNADRAVLEGRGLGEDRRRAGQGGRNLTQRIGTDDDDRRRAAGPRRLDDPAHDGPTCSIREGALWPAREQDHGSDGHGRIVAVRGAE